MNLIEERNETPHRPRSRELIFDLILDSNEHRCWYRSIDRYWRTKKQSIDQRDCWLTGQYANEDRNRWALELIHSHPRLVMQIQLELSSTCVEQTPTKRRVKVTIVSVHQTTLNLSRSMHLKWYFNRERRRLLELSRARRQMIYFEYLQSLVFRSSTRHQRSATIDSDSAKSSVEPTVDDRIVTTTADA